MTGKKGMQGIGLGGSREGAGRKQKKTLLERAQERVNRSPRLSEYVDVIFYDWPNWDEHIRWLLTASVNEIVDWARAVE